jgi:hypothetical protein
VELVDGLDVAEYGGEGLGPEHALGFVVKRHPGVEDLEGRCESTCVSTERVGAMHSASA